MENFFFVKYSESIKRLLTFAPTHSMQSFSHCGFSRRRSARRHLKESNSKSTRHLSHDPLHCFTPLLFILLSNKEFAKKSFSFRCVKCQYGNSSLPCNRNGIRLTTTFSMKKREILNLHFYFIWFRSFHSLKGNDVIRITKVSPAILSAQEPIAESCTQR